MKEFVYPRLLVPQAERFADKIGFTDATRSGVRYEATFGSHVERVQRLSHALDRQLALSHHVNAGRICQRAPVENDSAVGWGVTCPPESCPQPWRPARAGGSGFGASSCFDRRFRALASWRR